MKRRKWDGDIGDVPSQTAALRRLQSGISLPSRLSFRADIAALTHLRSVREGLQPSRFVQSRHAYISHLVASPDKALVAVASTDGHLEVHEPADSQSLRLNIDPVRGAKLSCLAWGTINNSDCLLMGLSSTKLALFDLNTCRPNRPTQMFNTEVRCVMDVTMLEAHAFAVSFPNSITLYDVRVKAPIAMVGTTKKEAVLASEDIFLYAADHGEVVLWDRRKMSSGPIGLGEMRKRSDSALSRRIIGTGRVNDIKPIPGYAPGCLFFHLADGTAGHVDMIGETVYSEPEKDIMTWLRPGVPESGLIEYGTAQRYLDPVVFPWFVRRRRGDIVRASNGSGWRAIVPNVKRSGFRFIGFADDMPLQTYMGSLPGSGHYTSIHAVNGELDRLILGDAMNNVHVKQVDFAKATSKTAPGHEIN